MYQPLAERMRPQNLDQVCGQQHLLADSAPLRVLLSQGQCPSLVFWGSAGVGKTTLARLIAKYVDAHFIALSAVLAGVKELREAISEAQQHSRGLLAKRTILFIDEIHRFNKSQQDALLPYVEDGTITLIGATTENPSFELNAALLSRLRVLILKPLSEEDLLQILQVALTDQQRGLAVQADSLPNHWLKTIAQFADGDARKALVLLETAYELSRAQGTDDKVLTLFLGKGLRRFDKGGDQFYEQISALHKSVRGSNPDAALYWLSRMLDGGADGDYLARRLLRMAIEDIGLADPRAQQLALEAWQSYERLGSPEGYLALANVAVYLACCSKSNAVYSAFKEVKQVIEQTGSLEVPIHLRNAPTKLMKELGFGASYRYDHDENGHAVGQQFLPDKLKNKLFYWPTERGLEGKIAERLKQLRQ
ncbi:MAG: replication-associated recombination protein A [Agitococcus sp.]